MQIITRSILLVLILLPVTPVTGAEPKHRRVVFVIGEGEYQTKRTLPAFARAELTGKRGFVCTFVHADVNHPNLFPGIEAVERADLVVLSVRRRALPEKQLAVIRRHLAAGKPLVGIRTASHAFDTRGKHPEGHAEWRTFDPDVLGGHYTGHHGNKLKTSVSVIEAAADHPVLHGVNREAFTAGGSLYKVRPLRKSCTPLLLGRVDGAEAEPVAWTNVHRGGRVFYTSLGHVRDFENPAFRRLLFNGIRWALAKP